MRSKLKNTISKLYSTGALHITIGTFMTKFVAFFGSIFVVRFLSKEDYGLISYVENIYSYALIFAGLGLSNAILRYLIVADTPREQKSYFKFIIKNSVVRNILLVIIMLIMSRVMNFPNNYSDAQKWLPVLAFLLPFQDLVNDDLFTLRAFFKNKLYAYASFSVSTALIVGRIVGAIYGGVGGVLWSRVIINFIFGTIGYYFVKKRMFISGDVEPLPVEKKRIVNSYSFQYMITNGFWALFMLNDTFLLGLLLNDPAVLADYKVAYVLPGNISIFATAIGVFVAPYFTKHENDNIWIKNNYKKVFILNAFIVGVVALIIACFGKELILIMYGEQYLNIVPLMRLLLLAAFLNSGLRFTTANLLAAMGEIKYNMYVSAFGIIFQVVADIVLIPKYGANAVAISNCINYLVMAVVLFIVFRKHFWKKN